MMVNSDLFLLYSPCSAPPALTSRIFTLTIPAEGHKSHENSHGQSASGRMWDRSHLAFTLLDDAQKQTSQEESILALLMAALVESWLMVWGLQFGMWPDFSPGRELPSTMKFSEKVADVKCCLSSLWRLVSWFTWVYPSFKKTEDSETTKVHTVYILSLSEGNSCIWRAFHTQRVWFVCASS